MFSLMGPTNNEKQMGSKIDAVFGFGKQSSSSGKTAETSQVNQKFE